MEHPNQETNATRAPHQRLLGSERAATNLAWMLAASWILTLLLAGLLVFRATNRAALAEAQVKLSETNDRAMEQALSIERLLNERLAKETIDLTEVRVALLSPARVENSPNFAVIWSPSNGEGILLRLSPVDLPQDTQFRLLASRQPSSDRIHQDTVFAKTAPPALERGLFRYQPAHPEDVSGFTLEITSTSSAHTTLRFGGALKP